MSAKNIAIFGGAFDPFHVGHLISITNILNNESPKIDKVLVMPSGKRPDKEYALGTEDRLGYIRRAIEGYPPGKVSLDETDLRDDFDGTYSLIENLRETLNPDVSLYFVIGDDLIPDLPKWRHAAELQNDVKFLVLPRNQDKVTLPDDYKMWMVESRFKIQVSSTALRKLIAENGFVQGLIP